MIVDGWVGHGRVGKQVGCFVPSALRVSPHHRNLISDAAIATPAIHDL